jgi:hypothetical protein
MLLSCHKQSTAAYFLQQGHLPEIGEHLLLNADVCVCVCVCVCVGKKIYLEVGQIHKEPHLKG